MSNPKGHIVRNLSKTPLYHVWQTMKQRCANPRYRGYQWYGAKGIKVCKEWNDVRNFYEWAMDNGYEEGLTLDRVDSSGNYEPSNCRWVTMAAQQSNKSNNHTIEYHGERHMLTQWSKLLGIPRTTLSNRLMSLGWSVERAFTERGAVL